MADTSDDWIKYDTLTHTYRTGDGTMVAAELIDAACCLMDILHIAIIRADQRAKMAKQKAENEL